MVGDYSIDIRKNFFGTFEENLNYYSKKMPNGCVEWTGNFSNKYGRINSGGKRLLAHRVAYEIKYGPIEMTKEIHHKCNNTKCINPEHLEALSSFHHIRKLKRDSNGRLMAHSKT